MRHHTIASLKARAKILKAEHIANGIHRTHQQCLEEAAREAGYRTYEAAHGTLLRQVNKIDKTKNEDKIEEHQPRSNPPNNWNASIVHLPFNQYYDTRVTVGILDTGRQHPSIFHAPLTIMGHGTPVAGTIVGSSDLADRRTSMATPHVSGIVALLNEKYKLIQKQSNMNQLRRYLPGSKNKTKS